MKKLTIKEVKERLLTIQEVDDPFIEMCLADTRKGVQTALLSWKKRVEDEEKLVQHYVAMNKFELEAKQLGYHFIAGIDEVGRGPLAGPVVAAAVILDPNQSILGLNDSKKLNVIKREQLYDEINNKAHAVGVGIVTPQEIDQINILQATKKAMIKAYEDLSVEPDFLLIDAVKLKTTIPQQSIIKGDMHSNSIMAASIIAKVTRDKLMTDYDLQFPGYGFASNAGYGTKVHLEGLEKYGATAIHRKTFSPVSKYLK